MLVHVDATTVIAIIALVAAAIFFGYAIGVQDYDRETKAMSHRTRSSMKNSAIRALRNAFLHAEAGDRAEAEASWHLAIECGYKPTEKTRIEFAQAMNGTTSADPQISPVPPIRRVRNSGP